MTTKTRTKKTLEVPTHTGPMRVEVFHRAGGLAITREPGELGCTITHERSGLRVAHRGSLSDTQRVFPAVLALTDWTQEAVALGRIPDLRKLVEAAAYA